MSSALQTLLELLESFEKNNQEFSKIISDNKRNLSALRVNSLLKLNFQECKPLEDLRNFYIFINYRNESPLGTKFLFELFEVFTKFFTSMPDSAKPLVHPFISSAYIDGLCKELNDLENLTDIVPWADLYKTFLNFKSDVFEIAEISTFKDSISIAVSCTSWNMIKDELDLNNLQEFEEAFRFLTSAAQIGLDVLDAAKNLAGYLLGELAIKFNGLSQEGAVEVRNETQNVRNVLIELLKLNIEDEYFKTQIDLVFDFFLRCGIFIREQLEIESLNFEFFGEKLSELRIQKILLGPVEYESYSLKVFHVKDDLGKDLALKIYTATENNFDLGFIHKDVQFLKNLSQLSTPDNCNLKFYGHCFVKSSFYYLIEYYPQNLADYLQSNILDEETFKRYALKLCQFFVYLDNNKFCHLDLRPQSILVVNEKVLKVFNFYNYTTTEPEPSSLMRDYNDFTAPEVFEGTRYIQKADIFSFGLILLYMFLDEQDRNLNFREIYKEFMQNNRLKNVEWLSSALGGMLTESSYERGSFNIYMSYFDPERTILSICSSNQNTINKDVINFK